MRDWELGIGPNPQYPIPNHQSPIPINKTKLKNKKIKPFKKNNFYNYKRICL